MSERSLFSEEHEIWRATVRRFVEEDVRAALRGDRQVPAAVRRLGYMWEHPICRAYAAARVVKIAGGSVEVMKTIIAREMFKGCLTPKTQRQ